MGPEDNFTRKLEVKDLRTGRFTDIEFKDVKPGMVFREQGNPYAEYGAINYPTKTHDIFGWSVDSFKLPATLYGNLDDNETLVRIIDSTTFEVIPKHALTVGDSFISSYVEHFIFQVRGKKSIAGVSIFKLDVVPFPDDSPTLIKGSVEKKLNDMINAMSIGKEPVNEEGVGRGMTYPSRRSNPATVLEVKRDASNKTDV